MKYEFEIDYLRPTYLLEKRKSNIAIDKISYRLVSLKIPVPLDFVNLQNYYLPNKGGYVS
jgi:hypothetical protein